jgi:TM2 domain-containing membrane protein YozV
MNCVNHTESPVSAYCQNCGKPLCDQCVRSVAGVIYCEPCLAAKLGVPGAVPGSYTSTNVGDSSQYQYAAIPPIGLEPGPNPGLATLLGFIPGVGAMYNGQFVKALVHVLVFVVLIGITDEHGIFGLFIAAWVFYQVFDANQTAKARRDGLPLPDPFGLNELGHRLGIQNPGAAHPTYPPPPSNPGQPPPPYASGSIPPNPPNAAPFVPNPEYVPFTPVAPMEPFPPSGGRRAEPIGAIVLIGLGLLFLFGTLGIFHFDWIGRGWPVIIILVGIWMFLKRTRETPQGGGQ